jgi:hypothetical protein
MEIQETATSRKTKFVELVQRYCEAPIHAIRWKNHVEFVLDSKSSYVEVIFDVGHSNNAELFAEAKWNDIKIVVYDSTFFDTACRVASAYEQQTGCATTVIKEF